MCLPPKNEDNGAPEKGAQETQEVEEGLERSFELHRQSLLHGSRWKNYRLEKPA
jgi:hypothetical protein